MKILTIHGYRGKVQNTVYEVMRSFGMETISPELNYDNADMENIFAELRKILDENQIDMITGTSLGGFFALVLAIERNLPVMLVNPCLMPFLHLPRLGYKGDISGFMKLFPTFTNIDQSKTYAVFGGKDEIIDTHDFTMKLINRYDIVPEGRHMGHTLNLEYYFKKELEKGGYI